MAFPSTSVLDDFNRANETPIASPWTADPPNQGWAKFNLSSSAVVGATASVWTSAYYSSASYARPCEVYVTRSDNVWNMYIGFIANPDSATAKGYAWEVRGDNTQNLYRITDAVFTQIDTTTATVAAGSVVGLSLDTSGLLTAYDDGSTVLDVTDTTHTGPFYLWLAVYHNAGLSLDNFGGGTSGQILLPDADTAAGGWTTEPLWSKLNDSSDSTYITATAT